jgi:hypothetical protein
MLLKNEEGGPWSPLSFEILCKDRYFLYKKYQISSKITDLHKERMISAPGQQSGLLYAAYILFKLIFPS